MDLAFAASHSVPHPSPGAESASNSKAPSRGEHKCCSRACHTHRGSHRCWFCAAWLYQRDSTRWEVQALCAMWTRHSLGLGSIPSWFWSFIPPHWLRLCSQSWGSLEVDKGLGLAWGSAPDPPRAPQASRARGITYLEVWLRDQAGMASLGYIWPMAVDHGDELGTVGNVGGPQTSLGLPERTC